MCPGSAIGSMAARLLAGQSVNGPPDDVVAAARHALARALGTRPPGSSGLDATTFDGLRAHGDPDPHLAGWLRHGAPLGILQPVPPSGIFPPVPAADPQRDLGDITTMFDGFTNYTSAEDEPETRLSLLRKMTDRGWAEEFSGLQAARDFLGSPDLVFNRLALITKERADGTLKHRLVWDLRRSGVNEFVSPGERVVLPRLGDVVRDARDLWGSAPHDSSVAFIGVDVSDAFHLIPLHPSEWKYTLAAVGERLFVFRVLVFGSASAPTVWGRFAALAGRLCAAVLDRAHARAQVYVDDPIVTLRGSPAVVQHEGALFLATLLALGLPLSWAKAGGGPEIDWIGAHLSLDPDSVAVSVPTEKAEAILTELNALKHSTIFPCKRLAPLAGRIAFFAGLIPVLRPFLDQYWAAIAACRQTPPAGDTRRLASRGLIPARSIRRSTTWFVAFFSGGWATLERRSTFRPPAGPALTIVTDASPWGIGGVEYIDDVPRRWFGARVTPMDSSILEARLGVSDSTTAFEALALVVAVRLFACDPPGRAVNIKSDSLSSLLAIAAGRGRSLALNRCMAELALDRAERNIDIRELRHIPGVANDVADALSRRFAPTPRACPAHLTPGLELRPDRRDRSWWRALG